MKKYANRKNFRILLTNKIINDIMPTKLIGL